jgi:aubergine
VDDIAWDASPKDKFMTKKEGEISFIDYYRKHYDQQIKNLSQPLLVSRPKEKDKRAGQKTDILLIPEFCALTGLKIYFKIKNILFKIKFFFNRHYLT